MSVDEWSWNYNGNRLNKGNKKENFKPRVTILNHNLRAQIHELRAQINELRVETHELRAEIYKFRFTSY